MIIIITDEVRQSYNTLNVTDIKVNANFSISNQYVNLNLLSIMRSIVGGNLDIP